MSIHRLALAITFASCSWGATAHALEPADSTDVETVTIASLYGTISADDDTTLLVGIEGCQRAVNGNGNININFTLAATSQFDLTMDPTTLSGPGYKGVYYFDTEIDGGSSLNCLDSSCTQLDSGDISRAMTSVDVQAPFAQIVEVTGEQECLTLERERDYFVRLQFGDINNLTPTQADARIRVDLVRPEPPASFEAVVTESAIELSWVDGPSTDVETYRIIYRTEQFDGDVFSDEITGSRAVTVLDSGTNTSTTSISDLEPGTVVWVAVASVDRVGNESVLTASQPFTVIDTIGFWDAYKGSGGAETGGYCSAAPLSSTPAGPAGTLLLCGLLFGFGATRARRQHGARS